MTAYRIDPKAPIIAVYAEIRGAIIARLKMVLDTGATYTLIPWDIADVLGYDPAYSKQKVDITTASGTEKAPLITVSRLSVLGKEAKDVPCIVHDLPETSGVDGLLGLSFLKRFKLSIDFRTGILMLE